MDGAPPWPPVGDALHCVVQAASHSALPTARKEAMRLSTFLVADHAEAVGGKLYVTGGCWNSLTVPQLPSQHPHLTVAAALHLPWQATNQPHSLHLDLIDGDGQSRLPEPLQG